MSNKTGQHKRRNKVQHHKYGSSESKLKSKCTLCHHISPRYTEVEIVATAWVGIGSNAGTACAWLAALSYPGTGSCNCREGRCNRETSKRVEFLLSRPEGRRRGAPAPSVAPALSLCQAFLSSKTRGYLYDYTEL